MVRYCIPKYSRSLTWCAQHGFLSLEFVVDEEAKLGFPAHPGSVGCHGPVPIFDPYPSVHRLVSFSFPYLEQGSRNACMNSLPINEAQQLKRSCSPSPS